jgi:glutamate-ammonia-ligase adenylyltransferase
LIRHPILLDELLDNRIFEQAPNWPEFAQQLAEQLQASATDMERQMDLMREQHHTQVFQLLNQDINGLLSVEKLADHLSALADITLEQTLACCWGKLRQRHREQPCFSIIGYGKLGGKELGYASDLDIVFIYDDSAPEAAEIYARLAQRITTWLASQTSAGNLFETDLRLRPNGESGLLVCSLEAFREYQLKSAWVWEHQALTRARFAAGDRALGARFEAIRSEILQQPRDLAALKSEVLHMRQKMRDNFANKTHLFDLKHDAGGLIDVEFIIQYLVLGYAHQYPTLSGNLGNIALLGIAADLGLIPPDQAEAAANAYRDFRRMQHAQRLNNQPSRVEAAATLIRREAVTALWHTVFSEGTHHV